MKKHYNLYYLYLEDKLANPMPEEQRQKILNYLMQKYRANKKTLEKPPP